MPIVIPLVIAMFLHEEQCCECAGRLPSPVDRGGVARGHVQRALGVVVPREPFQEAVLAANAR